jgi:pimeloyl-ACP methyl ester carboxylesterase
MLELTVTELAGQPDAPHLLVVGPSLGTSVQTLWARCAEALADQYQVVGWDLPGHGRSPQAIGPFAISDLGEAVRQVGAHWSGGRPAWYAGVSLGGAVGFELALSPGPYRAIAALASAPRIGARDAWRERADLVRSAGTASMEATSSQRWFAPTFSERDPQLAHALLSELGDVDDRSYAWACEALARFDRTSSLSEAEVPLLVAAGVYDVVLPPVEVNAMVNSAPRCDYRIIPDCGHLPPAEQPVRVARTLHEFFDRHTRGTRAQRWIGELHAAVAAASDGQSVA